MKIEDHVWNAVGKSVHEIILEELTRNKELIVSYAKEALTEDHIKRLVRDCIDYDDQFRDTIKDICVEKMSEKVRAMIDKL